MNAVYKVRIWQEEEKVLCCSNVCTEQSCERIGTCREVEIAEVVRCKDCDLRYQYPQNVFCNRHIGKVHDDGFCFEGKRRRDEE